MYESDSEVTIEIKVREGVLERKVIINLSTCNQTASGKFTSSVDTDS